MAMKANIAKLAKVATIRASACPIPIRTNSSERATVASDVTP
jgi:hypothetical protein